MYRDEIFEALQDFYNVHIIETVDSTFQIMRSFTYGEIVQIFLLTCILALLTIMFFWKIIID